MEVVVRLAVLGMRSVGHSSRAALGNRLEDLRYASVVLAVAPLADQMCL